MAKKIQSSDIFESKLFDVLLQEITKAETKLDGLSDKLKGVGKTLKDELGGLDLKSLDSIQKLLDKTKDLQKATDDAYKLEKERLKLENQKAILQEKLADTKKKYQLDEEQRLKKIADAEAKRLAKEKKVADDLANAYKQLEKNTRDLKNESKRLGAEMLELEKSGQKNTKAYRDLEKQYKETTKQAIEGDKALKKLDQTVGDNFRSVGNYEKAVGGLKNIFMQLGIALGAVDIAKYFIGTQVKLESLNLALKNVSTDTNEYQANVAFLREISQAYGQDLLSLTSTYKNFIASTTESNLTLSERKRIYESIVKSGSALALSNDDVQGTLRAVQQMFSKGTVQAEELRQQLGDRLPGAFGIMAKAVGVSEAELGKMMKNGEVLTDDVMPKFALLLEQEFGRKASSNLQTLNGSFNVLKNNLTIYFDSAQKNIGVNKFLASGILLVAKNIGFILKNITDLAIAFATYKAGAIALNAVNFVLEKGFLNVAKSVITGQKSITAFGMSLKQITFIAIIDGLIKTTEYFIDLANGTDQARESYEAYQNATKKGNDEINRYLIKVNDEFYKKVKALRADRKKELISQADLEKGIEEAELYRIDRIRKKMRALGVEREKYLSIRVKMRELNDGKPLKPVGKEVEVFDGFGGDMIDDGFVEVGKNNERDLFKIYTNYGALLTKVDTKLIKLNQELEKYDIQNSKVGKTTNKTSNQVAQHTKNVVDMNTKFKETNIYISKQIELLKELDLLYAKDKELKSEFNLDEIIKTQEKMIENEIKYNKEGVIKAFDEDKQKQLKTENERYNTIIQDNIDKLAILYAEERDSVLDEADKKFKELEKKEQKYAQDKIDNNANLKKKLSKASAQEVKEMKEKLIKDNKELAKIRKEIEENRDKELKVTRDNNTKRQQDFFVQEQIDLKNHKNKLNEIELKAEKDKNDVIEDLDLQLAEKKLENIKKMANATNDLVQLALESYIRTIENKIKLLDDRMNRIAQQSQFLQDKAIAGNITAQESLAKAQEDQLNAEKQKINYQRSIQRLQFALAVFNAYNNNIQNAKVGENPFTKTITDVSLLSTFIGSLPQFYKGTETTVADALGSPQLSGRDGHIVRVDGSEKILNPYLSQKTGDLTTFEIAKIAEDRLKGKLVYNQEINSTANNMWASMKLIDEIQDLKSIIKNKPETNIAMGEIVGGVMKIVETTKVSNTTTRNIHRFNKKI